MPHLNHMEQRVQRFQELHNNKWFHIMNYILDIIKCTDIREKRMLVKYGSCMYF
jgi:hypothetical protein